MFELKNNTNKALKIINVTEARANFATILSDPQSHYIITKNNKPQRVVIDFEEYRRFQALLENKEEKIEVEKSNINTVQNSGFYAVDQDQEDEKQTQNKRAEKIYPLQGVLKNQIELSKTKGVQINKQEEESFDLSEIKELSAEEKAEAFHQENVDEVIADEEPFQESQSLEETLDLNEENDDYFHSSEGEEDFEDEFEKILPEPEEDKLEESENIPVDNVADAAYQSEEEALSKEEKDYFRRFSKLYENKEEEKEKDLLTLSSGWENVVEEKSSVATDQKNNKEEFTNKPDDNNHIARENIIKQQSSIETQLPSLQELLKELDSEQDQNDKDPLDTSEIDEIINRITSD